MPKKIYADTEEKSKIRVNTKKDLRGYGRKVQIPRKCQKRFTRIQEEKSKIRVNAGKNYADTEEKSKFRVNAKKDLRGYGRKVQNPRKPRKYEFSMKFSK